LARTGLTADSLTTAETTLLAELDWWIDRHGDAGVPQAATSRVVAGAPYRLGRQVNNARQRHAHGQLAQTMVEQLQRRPGWRWNANPELRATQWDLKYEQLAAHLAQHDSLSELSTAVYQWLMRQRERLEQLEPDQQRRLLGLPAALERRDTRVHDFVAGARAWLAEHPEHDLGALRYASTARLPGHPEPYPLGRRATYYRRRYAGLEGTHPLPPDEVQLIAALPGWTWPLQDSFRRRSAPEQPSRPA
jgi:hypothetical protein